MTRRALLLGALLFPGVATAGPTQLLVETPPGLSPAAARLEESASSRVADVMDLVGLREAGPPIRVLLAPESSPMARSAPAWVSGYTDGVSNVVVLLPERTPSYPDGGLEDVLAHEVAHVLIYRASGGRRIPRWFNEGVAMLASRSWRFRDETHLAMGLLSGERISLFRLDDLFRGNRWQVERAYALSGALVQDLLDKYGTGLPSALFSRVAQGLSFEEALRRTTGATLIEVGNSFWARQSFLRRWLPILTSTAVLWLAISLLAIVAAAKRRRQRAAEAEALAEVEALAPSASDVEDSGDDRAS
ncbi:MAG TPA: hypothetical protein VLH41_03345 [Thermoanaerobaculia bacterium]|nr:hypothetical protein [Thermoanaerobaculia bacterium]